MNIYLGSDHAGFELKEKLVEYCEELGFDAVNLGAFSYDGEDDYPDVIAPVARAVSKDASDGIVSRGIILGGSGQGEAIVANRFQGVRAIVYYGEADPDEEGEILDIITLAREHNDANVLSLGARALSDETAKDIVQRFLSISFSEDERHSRRIAKIDAIEL